MHKILFRDQFDVIETYRVTGDDKDRVTEHTVIVDDIEVLPSGVLDGMAECIHVERAVNITASDIWWHFLWEAFNE